MKILKIRSLEGRWVDKDEILLHAAFQLLQDFVEKEHPEKTIDWKHDATHARAWRDISSLYRWWRETRPARRSPLDDKQIKRPPMRFEPVPNSTMRRLVPYDRKKYRAYDRAVRQHFQLEEKWHAEDQRNLHRLVEIRPYLWT
jgi:hypothetical protein